MRKSLCLALVLMMTLGLASGAWALEFSADMVMDHRGKKVTGKMFMKGDKMRMEGVGGQPGYSIIRGDKKILWVIMPQQRMYMETTIPEEVPYKANPAKKFPGEISRKKVGTEKIGGRPCTKYLVTQEMVGQVNKIYIWVAKGIDFPVKVADSGGEWTVEYRNIKTGSVPGSKFEVPSGYRKMSIPGMGKGMGQGMGPGGSPGKGRKQ